MRPRYANGDGALTRSDGWFYGPYKYKLGRSIDSIQRARCGGDYMIDDWPMSLFELLYIVLVLRV